MILVAVLLKSTVNLSDVIYGVGLVLLCITTIRSTSHYTSKLT